MGAPLQIRSSRCCRRLAALTLLTTGILAAGFPARPLAGQQGQPGRFFAELRSDTPVPAVSRALARRTGIAVRHLLPRTLRGFAFDGTATQASRLLQDPRVLRVSRDGGVSAIGHGALPVFGAQLDAFAVSSSLPLALRIPNRQRIPLGVLRCGANRSSTAAINSQDTPLNIDVAVLDTGIMSTHPDLNVVGGASVLGAGFEDRNGHGTEMAGVIAARDNRIGVVGVAPGARLWGVKVLDDTGNGFWTDVAAGLEWVTERAGTIKIAGLSIGGADDGAEVVERAIDACVRAGVTVVAAAGNSGLEVRDFVPARYEQVIAVSSLSDSNGRAGRSAGRFRVNGFFEVDERFSTFSNFGPEIDLIAPGTLWHSTSLTGYSVVSGTSPAAAAVAGGAALFLVRNPQATPAQVRDGLRAAGSRFEPRNDPDGVHEPALEVSGL
jgi:subtilisin family serine protease